MKMAYCTHATMNYTTGNDMQNDNPKLKILSSILMENPYRSVPVTSLIAKLFHPTFINFQKHEDSDCLTMVGL